MLFEQWRRDAIDLNKFEKKIQVNVTININLLLNRAPFYHFYSGLRKRKICITFYNGFLPNFNSPKMNKCPNF